MTEKVVFSKAPVKEVIFEIRFPASMSAACRRDKFYNEIRESYPVVILPKLSFEQHPFAQASQYFNEARTKLITCSSESFSFGTSEYENFKTFSGEVLRLVKVFFEEYRTINKITRIGLRYTNRIPVERKGNKVDLNRYLKFEFSLTESLDKRLLDFFQTAFFIELEKGTSGIRVSIDNRKEEGKDFLRLDLDLISLREVKIDEIEKYLVTYHDTIEEIFLDITTEGYKKSIR